VILANTSLFIVGNLSSNTQHMPRVTNVDSPLVVAGVGNHLSMFWILSYSVNIVCVYYKIRVFCNASLGGPHTQIAKKTCTLQAAIIYPLQQRIAL
jgi:hypothetical protein